MSSEEPKSGDLPGLAHRLSPTLVEVPASARADMRVPVHVWADEELWRQIARDRTLYSQHVAELGLMVAAGARRQGVGSALMKEAITWARGIGVVKLELTVFPHNEPAIALYRKLGFREEGLIGRRYLIRGRFIDAILMGLDVDRVEP